MTQDKSKQKQEQPAEDLRVGVDFVANVNGEEISLKEFLKQNPVGTLTIGDKEFEFPRKK